MGPFFCRKIWDREKCFSVKNKPAGLLLRVFSFATLFRLAGAERPVRPDKIRALTALLLNNAVRTGLTVWYLKCHV